MLSVFKLMIRVQIPATVLFSKNALFKLISKPHLLFEILIDVAENGIRYQKKTLLIRRK